MIAHQKVRDALATVRWLKVCNINLRRLMFYYPFKESEVESWFADGLLKAGLPGEHIGYHKKSEERKLTTEQIKKLASARRIPGFDFRPGKQGWIKRGKQGKAIFHDSIASDSGKGCIGGNRLCNR